MVKDWRLVEVDLKAARRVSKALSVSLPTGKLLVSRGLGKLKDIKTWLEPSLDDLHKSESLQGVPQAVKLVMKTIEAKGKISVYGDFDVDGVTATALLTTALSALGADVVSAIPDRFKHGYGLHADILRRLAEDNVKLLISVDCGITNIAETALAKELGLKVIVVDHHEPGNELPPADVIINPRQPGCKYPFKDLAGVGLAFKLAQALGAKAGRPDLAADQLDLVALGTVADLAPLVDENRALVKHGIDQLQTGRRLGILKLREAAGLASAPVSAHQIAFGLAPRLNAGGRLASAEISLRLLLTADAKEAGGLAAELDAQNRRRQQIEQKIFDEAVGLINEAPVANSIVLKSPGWHDGVKGIVASRIAARFFRPAILFSVKDGLCIGSGRSIPSLNLHDALGECREYLVKWGGHRAAVGATVREEDFAQFTVCFEAAVSRRLTEADLIDNLVIDTELEPDEVTDTFFAELSNLAPFGMGNPTPTFAMKNTYTEGHKNLGADGQHLKCLAQAGGFVGEAIAFKAGDLGLLLKPLCPVDMAFQLTRNHFNGRADLQLKIIDARPVSGFPAADGAPRSIQVPPPGTGFFLPSGADRAPVSDVWFIDRRGGADKERALKELLGVDLPAAIYVRDEHEGVQLANRLARLNGDLGSKAVIICRPPAGNTRLNRLLIYQMPLTGQAFYEMSAIGAGAGKKTIYLLWDEQDVRAAALTIESLCPDRVRLAEIYRALREFGPFDIAEAAALCRQKLQDRIYAPATRQLAALAVQILAELRLVAKDEGDKLVVSTEISSKVDIRASESWQRAQNFKRQFDDFAKIALTAPPERLLRAR